MDFFIGYVYRVLSGLSKSSNCKEMQSMTDERARVCLEYAQKSPPALMHLHKTVNVRQINCVPLHSRCCCTGKELSCSSGVQLILDDVHVCVSLDVLQEWFHYFRLRHFPEYMCGLIQEWVMVQPWYIKTSELDHHKLLQSHWASTYKKMYNESLQYLMTCCKKD